MPYLDKKLRCMDCMTGFTYTGEEQGLEALKGPSKVPSRCPACRASREALRAARALSPVVTSRRRY